MDSKEWHLLNFEILEKTLNSKQNMPFHTIRKDALHKFSELGFPTVRDETWKYTSIKQILKHNFRWSSQSAVISEINIKKFKFKNIDKNVLVFVNGNFNKELSQIDSVNNGIGITNLADAYHNYGDLVNKYLSKTAKYDSEAFTALNTAYVHDGAFIHIPDGKIIKNPIHLLYISDSGSDIFHFHPRNLIIAGKNSQCHIIESYNHTSDNKYLCNLVTELLVQENANVEHIKIQDESETAYHISSSYITQGKNSVYTSINIDLGGALVRNNINILLNGEYCECNLFGFNLAHNKQHIDNHTLIDHAVANCNSNESFKAIIDDKAKGVFNGKVLVRQDAQKTNAFQSNKTLLLTDHATMNSKPELEIFADDVKCSHGATIGQLDEEALFYLRTRGISKEMANSMLQFAFAEDILENIKIDSVRKKLNNLIHDKFIS